MIVASTCSTIVHSMFGYFIYTSVHFDRRKKISIRKFIRSSYFLGLLSDKFHIDILIELKIRFGNLNKLLSDEFRINISKEREREKTFKASSNFHAVSRVIYRGISDQQLYIDQPISPARSTPGHRVPISALCRTRPTRIFVPEARAPTLEPRERRQRSRWFELRKPPAHECRLASSRDHPVQRVEFVKIFHHVRSSSTERCSCVLARERLRSRLKPGSVSSARM